MLPFLNPGCPSLSWIPAFASKCTQAGLPEDGRALGVKGSHLRGAQLRPASP